MFALVTEFIICHSKWFVAGGPYFLCSKFQVFREEHYMFNAVSCSGPCTLSPCFLYSLRFFNPSSGKNLYSQKPKHIIAIFISKMCSVGQNTKTHLLPCYSPWKLCPCCCHFLPASCIWHCGDLLWNVTYCVTIILHSSVLAVVHYHIN